MSPTSPKKSRPGEVDLEKVSVVAKTSLLKGEAPILSEFRAPLPAQSQVLKEEPLKAAAVEKPEVSEEKKEEGKEEVKEEGKGKGKGKRRGQNKKRDRSAKIDTSADCEASAEALCQIFSSENRCPRGDSCRFNHDAETYFRTKRPEEKIRAQLSDLWNMRDKENVQDAEKISCKIFESKGQCPYGLNCLVGDSHISKELQNLMSDGSVVSSRLDLAKAKEDEVNRTSMDLKMALRKKQYPFSFIGAGGVAKEEIREKRCSRNLKEEWAGKTILAPLTTVGNLPFRRLCVSLGCDVTNSEMALAQSLLEGSKSEHALLQRHESEKCFGVQLAGGFADQMSKCVDFMVNEGLSFDFVDINMGCPLEGLHKKGGGSALMMRSDRIKAMVSSVVPILATKNIPLTCKLRMAHLDAKKKVGHKLVPQLCELGVSGVVVHGRSAQQRYTKLADWEYIQQCTEAVPEPFQSSVPLIGCGDVMSFEDWEYNLQHHGVDSNMIGRGALIKPWIFTEIKERRHWDISASERFDLLKRFCSYGLDHWGSDLKGVETTRRFLLEELSFHHRYIPVGLLEVVPQRINWRPPAYIGRSDLETLMGSANSQDWVRLSEMLLGPVQPNFSFVPKHKSNSWAAPVAPLLTPDDESVAKKLRI